MRLDAGRGCWKTVMNRRNVISLGAAILSSPFASSAALPASDARVADLVKTGKIRAGLSVAPIIATKDPGTGELRGVAVDIARELAAQIGVPLEQVPYPRPGAVMAGLKSNAWDLAFLGIDPGRAAQVDFTPAYLEVDLTYLVPANSPITRVPDADRSGVRIAVPRNDLVDILLSRMLTQATLVRADTVAAAFELVRTGQADVCAEPRPNLLQDQAHMPQSRVLADRFGVNRLAIAIPKDNPGRLAYLSEFIEGAKASGLVHGAIERAGLQGVRVAPAEKLTQ
jgi:polar amino acid transport system substrate-binding protein